MKQMSFPFFAIACSCGAFALLRGDPAMPECFVAEFADSSGLTWRETGCIPFPLTNAVERLFEAMSEQGYRLKHDIFDPREPEPDRHLFLWTKTGEEVTLMAWKKDVGTTGVSWGISAPEPEIAISGKENGKNETKEATK